MKNCKKCGKHITFLSWLGGDSLSLCETCKSKEKKRLERERQKEKEKEEKIRKAKNLLLEKGFHSERTFLRRETSDAHGEDYTYSFCVSGQGYSKILPRSMVGKEYPLSLERYNELLKKVIKNRFDVDKVLKEFYENLVIELEKEKIALRQKRLKLKQKAEKEYYGKIKTKREYVPKELKEDILHKFNHECVICGAKEGLHIHHKDKNSSNNKISNLIVLCGVCHKKAHMKVR